MSDVAWVGAVAVNFAASTSAGNPGEPAGCQDGDLLINALVTDTLHNTPNAPPTGWTKIAEVDVGTDSTLSLFWKIRNGVENQVWTGIFDANETGRAVTLAWRNADQTTPLDVAAVTGTEASTAYDAGPITPVTARAMGVAFFGGDPASDPYTFQWDAGITERIDSDTVPSGQNSTNSFLYVGEKLIDPPAATTLGGDATVGDEAAWIIIAIRPASSGTLYTSNPTGAILICGNAITTYDGPATTVNRPHRGPRRPRSRFRR